MSRIGKQPIAIPDGVTVKVDQRVVSVKGKNGDLSFSHHPAVKVAVDGKQLNVTRQDDESQSKALHGLTRAIIANAIKLPIPASVKCTITDKDNQKLTLVSADKHAVGQFAAVIRRVRPPEPYKGKGIRYEGERVRRKAGKAFAGAGSG